MSDGASAHDAVRFGGGRGRARDGIDDAARGGPRHRGYNAEDDAGATCGFSAANNDVVGSPLGFAALADNGGPGLTQLPQAGSVLLDAIPPASCQADGAAGVTTDERGVTRPQGPGCEIGAVEVEVVAPPTPTPAVVIAPMFTG